jgi:hypothetical protein
MSSTHPTALQRLLYFYARLFIGGLWFMLFGVGPSFAIDLNLQTLSGLTVNKIFQSNTTICSKILGSYVEGGNGQTGLANDQSSSSTCGIGSTPDSVTPEVAIDSLDHIYLNSDTEPTVLDFGSPQKTVVVFDAIIEQPVPQKALERTVWGSNSSNIDNFPRGWTMATLNTIWKLGWTDPAICQPGPNSDDYSGQYTFVEEGFRYIALFADASVSIFNNRAYNTWNPVNDDRPHEPGWQSNIESTDAVGAPICSVTTVIADAGEDQEGTVGETICFSGANTKVAKGTSTVTMGWDLDDDGAIDLNHTVACIVCDEVKSGELFLFVTEQCGCADTDSVLFSCVPEEIEIPEPDIEPYNPPPEPEPLPPPPPFLPPAIPPDFPPADAAIGTGADTDTSFPIFDPDLKPSSDEGNEDSKSIKPIYETRGIGCNSGMPEIFWALLVLLFCLRRRDWE